MGQMDFISSIFVRFFFSKLSGKHFIDHTLQMYRLINPTVCAFYPDSQTVETLRSACIFMCGLVMLSL